MNSSAITKCPHCQATFLVEDANMERARCGSCLRDFVVRDSLVVHQEPLFDDGGQPQASAGQGEDISQIIPVRALGRLSWGFVLVGTAGVLLILLQILFWQPSSWSGHGWYQELRRLAQTGPCSMLPCPRRMFVDLQRLHIIGLIEPYPADDDACSLRLELHNAAPFAQPLPRINLRLVDATGRVRAGRALHPRHYATGLLSGRARIAAGERMQFYLPLADDGECLTLGYRLDLQEPL